MFRFFAALWVVFFHFQSQVSIRWPNLAADLVQNGAYAMSFFFVLSGTVLAYGCSDIASRPAGISRFYLARLARLYPIYALGYLVSLPWIEIDFPGDWARWGFVNTASLLGIQAWFPQSFVGANRGLWSLSCEFFFYALFPALLPLALRLGRGAALGRAVVYLSLFVGFIGLADFAFGREYTFPLCYISPALRLPEFFLGMVLGAALRQLPAQTPRSVLWLGLPVAAVFLASLNQAHQAGLWIRANIIVVPALAWLIYATARHEILRPAVTRGICWRLLHYLGEASYCLFVVQMPVLLWFAQIKREGHAIARWAHAAPVTAWCAGLAFLLLISVVLHEIVEKPLRKRLLARFAPPRPA